MAPSHRPRHGKQPEQPEKEQLNAAVDPHTHDLIRGFAALWRCSQGMVITKFTEREIVLLKKNEKDYAYLQETVRRVQEDRLHKDKLPKP